MSLNYSFVKDEQELQAVRNMNASNFPAQEKIQIFWTIDPEVGRKVLPPHLEPVMPFGKPIISAYVANYGKPENLLPYTESALFILASINDVRGVYCLSMTLGGSDQASDSGKMMYGYPKKQGHVHFQRLGDKVYGWAERNYIRFFECEATMGAGLNNPTYGAGVVGPEGPSDSMDGAVLLLKNDYDLVSEGKTIMDRTIGDEFNIMDGFTNPRIISQYNDTHFLYRKHAHMDQMHFKPSEDDPWIEVAPPTEDDILGAYYTHCAQEMRGCKLEYEYKPEEIPSVQPYMFLPWDTWLFGKEHTAQSELRS